ISSINFFLFFLFQTKKPSSFSFTSEVGCTFRRQKSAVITTATALTTTQTAAARKFRQRRLVRFQTSVGD
ncbi:hypothetical protein LINGRAHAP2_LOCUS26075, partial [Linum grandiflorum]